MKKLNKPIIDMKNTGAKLKSLRQFKKVSVKNLQEIFGMENPQAIYNWESGKNMPSIDNLLILANIYDVSLESIIAFNTVEIDISEENRIPLKAAV